MRNTILMVVVRRAATARRDQELPAKAGRAMGRHVLPKPFVAALLGCTVAVLPGASRSVAASGYATVTDYCQGQCADILPPGENGNATLADILLHKIFGTRPAHAADQLDRYAN